MSRTLRLVGFVLILLTIVLWVGDAVDLIPQSTDDRWSGLTLKAGLVTLAAAFVLGLVTPVAKQIRKGRCTICGHPVLRGHLYCQDHLQEAVNAGRDKARKDTASRRNPIL